MKLIQAQLIKAPRQVTTKYGIRTVADAIDENGNTQVIWRPENDPVLSRLTVNSRVTLCQDSKGKLSLVDNQNEPTAIAPQSESNNHRLTDSQKKEIASYIQQQRDLLAFCLEQAATIPNIETEDIRPLATTLFLSAQKRFGLA